MEHKKSTSSIRTISRIALLLLAISTQPATALPPAQPYCWHTLAPIGSGPRQEHGTVAIGTTLYIVGGLAPTGTGTTTTTAKVDVYNTTSNRWTTAAPLPVPMHHPNMAAVAGRIYVLGGEVGAANTEWQSSARAFRYEPGADRWDELAAMPAGRGSAVVGVRGQTIYLAGGRNSTLGLPRTSTDLVSMYDTVVGTWAELPKMPEERDHAGGMVIGDTLYFVGGRVAVQTALRGNVFALNLTSSKWSEVSKMPTARGGIAAAAVGSKIYTFGGEGNPAIGSKGVFSDSESYDVVGNVWTKEVPMKTPRHGTAAVAVGDSVYVPGGGDVQGGGSALDIHEAYGPC